MSRIKGAPDLAAIPMLAIAQGDDVEERVRLLEAGADDVVSRPVDPLELQLRIDTLLVRPPESAPTEPAAPSTGAGADARADRGPARACWHSCRPRAVPAPRPQRSTWPSPWPRSGRSVAIIDLHLTFGGVALHLDVVPRFSVVEAVRDDQALDDPEALRAYATMRDTLAIFSAPLTPDQADMVTAEHVRRLLAVAASAFDVTVVDGGNGFGERTVTIAGMADRLAILATPEIPALRAVRALTTALAEYEPDNGRHVHVLNHVFPADMLLRDEVRAALGASELQELPYAQTVYHKAVVTGVPVVVGAPRSEAAEKLVKLAGVLMGESNLETAESARRLRLSGLRRRG